MHQRRCVALFIRLRRKKFWSKEEFALQLLELRQLSEAIRQCLDGISEMVDLIDHRLVRMAELRPELGITLVADVMFGSDEPHLPGAPGRTLIAACLRVPGGLGLALWQVRAADPAVDQVDSTPTASVPSFMPMAGIPPLIRRLLATHFEYLLQSLQERLQD